MSITVDKEQLLSLRRDGAKIERPDGQGLFEPEQAREKSELDLLAEISGKLERLIEKQDRPDPEPVHIPAPKVTVHIPETKRIRVKKFKLIKNERGRTTEVIPIYEE